MEAPAQKKLLALDTNLLFDLAAEKDSAHTLGASTALLAKLVMEFSHAKLFCGSNNKTSVWGNTNSVKEIACLFGQHSCRIACLLVFKIQHHHV